MSGYGSIVGTQACGSIFPEYVTVAARTRSGEKQVVVTCNRPFGHEGNCMYSTSRNAREYEWTRGVIVRGK